MANREDTEPSAQKNRTDPGVGGPVPDAGARAGEDPAPVDFDALHAALGANADASGRRSAVAEVEVELETPEAPRVAESQGRSSASYASTHALPKTRAPADADPAMPAIIVEADTNPGNQGTVPIAAPHASSGPHAAAHPAASSGPYQAAAPAHAPSHPFTPPGAFPAQGVPGPKKTMVMPQRPRRPKSATIVVRPRGPSTFQKVAAFIAMLLLVTACGIAVIVWRKPRWLGFEPIPGSEPAAAPKKPAPPAAKASH